MEVAVRLGEDPSADPLCQQLRAIHLEHTQPIRLGRDRLLQRSLGGAARNEQNYSSPQRGKRNSRHRWSHDQRRGNKAKGDALRATVCAEHQRIQLKKETVPNHARNICVHLTSLLRRKGIYKTRAASTINSPFVSFSVR